MTKRFALGLLATMLAACSGSGTTPLPTNLRPRITAPAGYTTALFAKGSKKNYNPDPIVIAGAYVYVAFQSATQPTGSGGNSTIVQYTTGGKIVKSIDVLGR